MKKITVLIDETGEFTVDLSGFHGKGCDKVLSDFGGPERPTLERTKAEYGETVREKEKARG